MSKNRNLVLGVLSLPLLGALVGCSRDVVELGDPEGTDVVVLGARCVDSAVVTESVRVTSQADVDALAGCEEIQGDLKIWYFKDPDLSSLYALRTVTGALELTPLAPVPLLDENNELVEGQESPYPEMVNWRWLDSLQGLESLRQVGSFYLYHTQVSSLEPLANLRSISGALTLFDNDEMLNLKGLGGIQSLGSLVLYSSRSLESLDGLTLPPELDSVTLANLTALTNIDALQSVTKLRGGVLVSTTGLEDLRGLSHLTEASQVGISLNARLRDASGLGALTQVEALSLQNNQQLTVLPAFSNLSLANFRSLNIGSNDALETVSLDFPMAQQASAAIGSELHNLGVGVIQIALNPSLRSITAPAGLASAELLSISENVSLNSIDLGSFEHLDALAIENNRNLAQLGLGSVQTIGALTIRDNPKLSVAPLASLRTFERTMSGNAD